MRTLLAVTLLPVLTGCETTSWLVTPEGGSSPLEEAVGTAGEAFVATAAVGGSIGPVLGGIAAAIAAGAVILKRKAKSK